MTAASPAITMAATFSTVIILVLSAETPQLAASAGSNSGTDAEVENCYNTGSIIAQGSYAGGIVGRNSADIRNSYNVGSVEGTSNTGRRSRTAQCQ